MSIVSVCVLSELPPVVTVVVSTTRGALAFVPSMLLMSITWTPPPASVRQLWDGEAPDWEPLRQDPRAPELALQVLLPLSEALDAGRQLLTPTCRDPWQPLEEPEP